MCATLMCLRSPRWSVTDSRDKRRAQIVFGAGVAFFRVLSLLPFVLFFVLIPGGRLTTAAFIGNANGSKAVTLAFSLPTIGLRVGVLRAWWLDRASYLRASVDGQQHKLSLRRSPPTRPSPTSGVHRWRAQPPAPRSAGNGRLAATGRVRPRDPPGRPRGRCRRRVPSTIRPSRPRNGRRAAQRPGWPRRWRAA
jgi:hypothetical protein